MSQLPAIKNLFKDLDVVLLPDTNTHRLRMEIQSETSDNVYVVSQRMLKSGGTQFECGCKGWIFKRKCKHLTNMTPMLEQAARLLDGGKAPKAQIAAPAPKKAAKPAPKAAPKKSGVKSLEGLTIESAEGGKSGLTLVLSDGSTLEISSVYEGGIKIEVTAEEQVVQKKKVTKDLA